MRGKGGGWGAPKMGVGGARAPSARSTHACAGASTAVVLEIAMNIT